METTIKKKRGPKPVLEAKLIEYVRQAPRALTNRAIAEALGTSEEYAGNLTRRLQAAGKLTVVARFGDGTMYTATAEPKVADFMRRVAVRLAGGEGPGALVKAMAAELLAEIDAGIGGEVAADQREKLARVAQVGA